MACGRAVTQPSVASQPYACHVHDSAHVFVCFSALLHQNMSVNDTEQDQLLASWIWFGYQAGSCVILSLYSYLEDKV